MRLEALKSKQKEIFKKLPAFSDFYLVGGTALALQIGHRTSVDFDLFRKKELDKNFIAKIYRVFKNDCLKFSLRHSEQINLEVNSVKFNFVKYPHNPLWKLKIIQGVKMASAKDIAVMKAFTLGKRATLKDYADLYFILKQKIITLEQIIRGCQKKYKQDFNDRLFLEELTYLEDVSEAKIEFLKEAPSRGQMIEFFEEEIKKVRI